MIQEETVDAVFTEQQEDSPRICLFTALYRPSMGGVETYVESLARALVGLGCSVCVATCDTHGLGARGDEGGASIVRFPCTPLLDGRFPLVKDGAEAEAIWARLEEASFDYVVVNTRFYTLTERALAFAERIGVTPLLIEHGSAHLTMGSALIDPAVRFVEHALTKRDSRHPFHAWAVSKKASAWLAHFGIESHGEIPNSIDADEYAAQASERDFRREFSVPEEALLVAFAGRLVPEKGVVNLARAVAAIADAPGAAEAPVHLVIAGAGAEQADIEAVGCASVHLAGRLDRPDMAALLAQADVLGLPSRSEGFATTLLEAAACATPAIVTPVGGTDELIASPAFGTIIPNAEVTTIEAALREAARNRTALGEQGRAVQAEVRSDYSWKRTAERALDACRLANPNARKLA